MMMILRPQGLLPGAAPQDGARRARRDLRRHPLHGKGMSATEAPTTAALAGEPGDPDGDGDHEAVRRPDRGERRHVRRCRSARSSRSSAPTAPARRRTSTCSPGFYRPTLGSDRRSTGKNITGARPDIVMKAGHGADVPEHPAVLDDDGDGERDDRRALADARRPVRARSSAPPRVRREEREVAREGARRARVRGHHSSAGTTISPSTSPTATSGGWRSPARWRPTRRCCCSTSRRRG